ncbi:hypothetical protein [Burkholderia sp. B21-005]|uniref:hypothetical protein n=1 Tax=Burkholderia sp. B21-005 TaxID=2890406 RepID=UPI001E2EF714|nr:hypothetical protein [Burkholderia sp. B21-005]UEP42769.1 hypothetical protein LMA02_07390 [Burkholderia sp. B21-005]
MTTLIVQFSDSMESEVIAYFSAPQDSAAYENLGTVDVSDARWMRFYQNAGGPNSKLPEAQSIAPSTSGSA